MVGRTREYAFVANTVGRVALAGGDGKGVIREANRFMHVL